VISLVTANVGSLDAKDFKSGEGGLPARAAELEDAFQAEADIVAIQEHKLPVTGEWQGASYNMCLSRCTAGGSAGVAIWAKKSWTRSELGLAA